MKMKMKIKNRSYRYDINGPRSRHGHKYSKYRKGLVWWCLCLSSNTYATFEGQFMKKFSNTEAELKKKRCLEKKRVYLGNISEAATRGVL